MLVRVSAEMKESGFEQVGGRMMLLQSRQDFSSCDWGRFLYHVYGVTIWEHGIRYIGVLDGRVF